MDQKLELGAEGYSPRVLQLVVRQGGGRASAFAEASEDLKELAEVEISPKHVERLVERVGKEWADARDAEVELFKKGQLKRDYAQAPAAAAVMLDGAGLRPARRISRPGCMSRRGGRRKWAVV